MGRKQEIFESVLTSAYDHNRFVDFSREIITGLNLKRYDIENKPYNTFSNFIARYFQIGDFIDPEDNTVGIFSVELKRGESVERARTAQRTFVKRLLENGSYSAALVAFYSLDTDKWRFSFVRMDYEFAKGKIKESLTPARRYSYLVGKGEPCHTAMDRLLPIFMDDSKNPTIDEIEESFSVEKVTKDFFEAYKEKYLQLADYLNNNEDFVRESNVKHFTTEQFTKKLLSQIVFLYFIQKKGWLGVSAIPKTLTEREYKNAFFSHGSMSRELVGKVYYQDGEVFRRNAAVLKSLSDEEETEFAKCVKGEPWGSGPKDFMRRIFDNAVKNDQNFFDDCLEPLFYTGLNQDRGDNAFFPPLHCRIPFLNGGLFEELEHYEWRYNDFDIPNEIFSNAYTKGREADGILDIFDRYNFTMAEDEPLEKEVAVDPEMLGKVFENLLEVRDRKSKGAFYTPREIVHYMCSESLINYLTTNSGIPEDDIRKFITLGEFFKDDDARRTVPVDNKTGEIVKDLYTKGYHYEFDYNKQLEMPATILDFKNNVNRIDELDKLLADVRVVDPAVGSGAFPLGLLNEIVKARDTLTTYMAIPMSDFKRKMLYVTRSPYQLKTETIKNCIFACDIEPSATDITKLRLWLSLVIEDEIGEKENDEFGEHTKPRKLPNLDCNVLCGNSLISSFEGIDLICNTEAIGNQMAGTNRSISDIAIESHINGLIDLQNQLYSAETSTQKEEIKKSIQVLYDAIIVEQLQVNPAAVNDYLDIRNASSKPFILWQLYFPKVFKDKGGFDICIGNPPYVDSEEMTKSMPKERELYAKKYKCAKGNWDLFIVFIEKGIQLLRKQGVISFIVPNKLIAAPYSEKIRSYMAERRLIEIRDYSNVNVFVSAAVYPVVFRLQNSDNKSPVKMAVMAGMESVDQINIINPESFYEDIDWDRYFNATNEALELISRIRKNPKLGDIAKVNGAATVGEAYLVKEFLKDSMPMDDSQLKFINTGGIDKYLSFYGKEKIRYLKGAYEYPSVSKADLGKMSERRLQESQTEKIIIGGMNKELECIYDDGQYLAGKSTTIVYGHDYLKYITAVLNSSLMTFYYRTYYNSMTLQGGYLRIGAPQVKNLPICIPSLEIIKCIEEKVDKIQSVLNLNGEYTDETNSIYKEIDDLIYQVYGFSSSDIEIASVEAK